MSGIEIEINRQEAVGETSSKESTEPTLEDAQRVIREGKQQIEEALIEMRAKLPLHDPLDPRVFFDI